MTEDFKPTPEDLARDLAADLWHAGSGNRYISAVLDRYCKSWPAAIRRALAAEAEVARLTAEVTKLQGVIDQHGLCHDLKPTPEDMVRDTGVER